MHRYFFIGLIFILGLVACRASRVTQNEAALFPETGKGKWWIINTILQDMNGKDVHFNSLVSIDKMGDKNYAACFVSVWNESANTYYSAARTADVSEWKFKTKFPLRISFPGKDSLAMEWSLVLKRNGFNFLTELNNKTNALPKGYTELSAGFNKQGPFSFSGISAAPQAWAVAPVIADVKLSGNMQSSGPGKLLVRIFSDKEILLKKSSGAFVHWLDLALSNGKQLSILFSTDATLNTATEAVLLWNEQGNIMARPQMIFQKESSDKIQPGQAKQYPLFFSIELPEQQLKIILRPRMIQQEITANKNSFWMGAVEAIDKQSGQPAGKGNMYIFKQ
jgi:Lipocalin-like domain